MSCYFTQEEMKSLLDIKEKVISGTPLSELCGLPSFKNGFPLLYEALLLAMNGRKEEALTIYNSGLLKHHFADEFFRFLKKTGSVEPKVVVFKSSLPYDAWVKTNLFKVELDSTLKTIGAYSAANLSGKETLNILDIGPGNGRMTAHVINRIIKETDIKSLNLVLLDKFPAMLESAKDFCERSIKADVRVETICCLAQSMTEGVKKILNEYAPFDAAICSRSIHHMTADLKLDLLKELKKLVKLVFLVEMNSTHDLPDKDHPDLIYSVVKSYGYIFDDIRRSALTGEEMIASIDDFLLAEALFILGKDRAERIDYHATSEEWADIATKAGFSVPVVEHSAIYPDGEPHYFTMIMSN